MDELKIITNAIVIKETIGFAILDNINEVDHPNVIKFATICHNYMKMERINEEDWG